MGSAPSTPIVFIHGFPFSKAMWDPQVEALKTFPVITYDLRGHGQTPAGDGQYTIDLFVDDLLALLDQKKIPKAILCGLSMGGYIALRAIERAPERVAGLVLADTRSEADTNEAKIKRAAGMKAVEADKVAYAEGFLKAVFAPESFETNRAAVEKIRRVILANPTLGIRGALLAMAARTDTTPALSAIKVPTLILVGEKDAITPPAASEALHAKITGSEMHVIPDAAHMSNLENSAEFNRHLLHFLERISHA